MTQANPARRVFEDFEIFGESGGIIIANVSIFKAYHVCWVGSGRIEGIDVSVDPGLGTAVNNRIAFIFLFRSNAEGGSPNFLFVLARMVSQPAR